MSLSNTLSAASTLIGYIGTEVATTDCFNRVLWPQRSYNNFSLRNAWIPALLMPLGGPLYTAALKTVDTFLRNGLFLRPNLGNMLGTAFFPDSGMHYHLYEDGVRSREAQVRNGIWVQVLQEMPMIAERMEKKVEGQVEDGSQKRGHIRQLTPVNHLILSPARAEKPPPNVRMRRFSIDQDIGAVTLRTIVAIITTEITGVSVAIAVAVIWRSAFMVLWLVPLVLKLISAFCTIPREPLILNNTPTATTQTSGETPTTTNFLITSGQGFHIIEGPPHIVLQFFRHYGHPRRSQWNERVQIAVVFAFGLNFPVGLVVSIMCMPTTLQCVWTGYVLYATLAMYVSRYTYGQWWLTTEERIANALIYAEGHPGEAQVLFRGADDGVLEAELIRTLHSSYQKAKEHAMRLLEQKRSQEALGEAGESRTAEEKGHRREDQIVCL